MSVSGKNSRLRAPALSLWVLWFGAYATIYVTAGNRFLMQGNNMWPFGKTHPTGSVAMRGVGTDPDSRSTEQINAPFVRRRDSVRSLRRTPSAG